jgi:hypothetical protein
MFFRYVNKALDALLLPSCTGLHRCSQPDCLALAPVLIDAIKGA